MDSPKESLIPSLLDVGHFSKKTPLIRRFLSLNSLTSLPLSVYEPEEEDERCLLETDTQDMKYMEEWGGTYRSENGVDVMAQKERKKGKGRKERIKSVSEVDFMIARGAKNVERRKERIGSSKSADEVDIRTRKSAKEIKHGKEQISSSKSVDEIDKTRRRDRVSRYRKLSNEESVTVQKQKAVGISVATKPAATKTTKPVVAKPPKHGDTPTIHERDPDKKERQRGVNADRGKEKACKERLAKRFVKVDGTVSNHQRTMKGERGEKCVELVFKTTPDHVKIISSPRAATKQNPEHRIVSKPPKTVSKSHSEQGIVSKSQWSEQGTISKPVTPEQKIVSTAEMTPAQKLEAKKLELEMIRQRCIKRRVILMVSDTPEIFFLKILKIVQT